MFLVFYCQVVNITERLFCSLVRIITTAEEQSQTMTMAVTTSNRSLVWWLAFFDNPGAAIFRGWLWGPYMQKRMHQLLISTLAWKMNIGSREEHLMVRLLMIEVVVVYVNHRESFPMEIDLEECPPRRCKGLCHIFTPLKTVWKLRYSLFVHMGPFFGETLFLPFEKLYFSPARSQID